MPDIADGAAAGRSVRARVSAVVLGAVGGRASMSSSS
jgi:hypothetical protein